jgi:pantoate kinase
LPWGTGIVASAAAALALATVARRHEMRQESEKQES